MNRGFVSIGVVIMLVALLIMGGGGYYIMTQPNAPVYLVEPTLQNLTNLLPTQKTDPTPVLAVNETKPSTNVSATLTVDVQEGESSLTIQVNARIEVPNSHQESAIIFYGDGTSDIVHRSGPSLFSSQLMHTYARPGSYEIILVTSSIANLDADIEALKNPFYAKNIIVQRKSINIAGTSNVTETAKFQASPLSGKAPLTVVFTDMGSVTGIIYGDGATCSDMAPGAPESVWCHTAGGVLKTHTYTQPGTYLVRASRSTPSGIVGEVTITVY